MYHILYNWVLLSQTYNVWTDCLFSLYRLYLLYFSFFFIFFFFTRLWFHSWFTFWQHSQSNPSVNIAVCGDFNIHYSEWYGYAKTDTAGLEAFNFSVSQNLSQIVDFPTRFPDNDVHSPSLLDYFQTPVVVKFPANHLLAFLIMMWFLSPYSLGLIKTTNLLTGNFLRGAPWLCTLFDSLLKSLNGS